ncbi:MAG: hypothetical protein VKK62_06135 [Synechococcaceae cyanobacterium]|nr:hypothetical protein [Synechococcaceae cyanobacterium]
MIALGDGGSGNETGTGLANVETNITQPYNLIVSGTSLSTLDSALDDETLKTLYTEPALAGDLPTLWPLMQAGLTSLPSRSSPKDRFIETVWNSYEVDSGKSTITDLSSNNTSAGGIDPTRPAPSYQVDYGISPVSANPAPYAQTGRGVPDVSVNAGGNMAYKIPKSDMKDTTGQEGTSAATPFWASLVTQINAINADQGLPNLGYMNDLLYIASAVSPGSFNDVQVGNNTSSYYQPGPYSSGKQTFQPTGFGYEATPGYDLVTGLGSPNGTLLAIALTNIGHAQYSTADPDPVLVASAQGPLSGADQTLLFQASTEAPSGLSVSIGTASTSLISPASESYAWTSQLAQQSLQADFDPALLRLFDGAAQGASLQSQAGRGAAVAVNLAAAATSTPQFNLSSDYGFVDFVNGAGGVRSSRPVSVATTPGDADDAEVVVRMRQNGADAIATFFYRVDTLTGLINGLAPGDPGYEAAAQSRRYAFSDGQKTLLGSGYGNYSQGLLIGVDAGDLIALGLNNLTRGQSFWGFAEANETVDGVAVNHLWNYGMNVYGFEDTLGGGDRDFQDAVVQLDYASGSGSQWLLGGPGAQASLA